MCVPPGKCCLSSSTFCFKHAVVPSMLHSKDMSFPACLALTNLPRKARPVLSNRHIMQAIYVIKVFIAATLER